MKKDKQIEKIPDEKLTELFNQANSTQEKLQYFSKIQDYNIQMNLLESIPINEKYKFIVKIKSMQGIAMALNSLGDDKTKSKTFNYIAKQFKGNNEGILKILNLICAYLKIKKNYQKKYNQ